MRRIAMTLALTLALTMVLAACGGDDSSGTSTPSAMSDQDYINELESQVNAHAQDQQRLFELITEVSQNPAVAAEDAWKNNVGQVLDSFNASAKSIDELNAPAGATDVQAALEDSFNCWSDLADRTRPMLDSADQAKLTAEFNNLGTCTEKLNNANTEMEKYLSTQ